MTSGQIVRCAIAVSALAAACGRADSTPGASSPSPAAQAAATQAAAPQPRVLERPTDVITLPIALVGNDTSDAAVDRLAVRDEKLDQEAEGPQSFDVLPDNRIVVADPLRDRALVFDRRGSVVHRVDVGAPVRTVAAAGEWLSVGAPAQAPRLVDMNGAAVQQPPARGSAGRAGPPPLPRAQVTLDEGRRAGTIHFAAPAFGAPPGQVEQTPRSDLRVRLEATESRLASVRVIRTDDQRRTYVAIEVMAGDGSATSPLSKMIRRYASDGRIDVEIRGIPIDYFIVPIAEFKVVRDVVYQLLPHRDAVLINVWDLSR